MKVSESGTALSATSAVSGMERSVKKASVPAKRSRTEDQQTGSAPETKRIRTGGQKHGTPPGIALADHHLDAAPKPSGQPDFTSFTDRPIKRTQLDDGRANYHVQFSIPSSNPALETHSPSACIYGLEEATLEVTIVENSAMFNLRFITRYGHEKQQANLPEQKRMVEVRESRRDDHQVDGAKPRSRLLFGEIPRQSAGVGQYP
jgi:hypothetical protein